MIFIDDPHKRSAGVIFLFVLMVKAEKNLPLTIVIRGL